MIDGSRLLMLALWESSTCQQQLLQSPQQLIQRLLKDFCAAAAVCAAHNAPRTKPSDCAQANADELVLVAMLKPLLTWLKLNRAGVAAILSDTSSFVFLVEQVRSLGALTV